MGDTAPLAADPYVGLTVAAATAPKLKLLVGVTNPVTRHPALTACAIASVQIESNGRAVLGIGRGDQADLVSVSADSGDRGGERLIQVTRQRRL